MIIKLLFIFAVLSSCLYAETYVIDNPFGDACGVESTQAYITRYDDSYYIVSEYIIWLIDISGFGKHDVRWTLGHTTYKTAVIAKYIQARPKECDNILRKNIINEKLIPFMSL